MTKASDVWNQIDEFKHAREEEVVADLLDRPPVSEGQRKEAVRIGQEIVQIARANAKRKGIMELSLIHI